MQFIIPALVLLLLFSNEAESHPTHEHRYTDVIQRDKQGRILRRADVIKSFKAIHPCPSTGKTSGKCPRWSIDHVIPLACYGKDEVSNMQWLPLDIKTCKGVCKDRWERKIYSPPMKQWRYCQHP